MFIRFECFLSYHPDSVILFPDIYETFRAYMGMVCRLPTMIFAECVLIYMDPAASRKVVKRCADKFETAAFIIYEQVRLILILLF